MHPWLKEPKLNGLAPGSIAFFETQRALILERPLLKRAYEDWYRLQLEDLRSAPPAGAALELGSGGSFLNQIEPSIITSDVVPAVAERVVDGRALPFPDASIRALLLSHVFHHIPDVGAFFAEAQRTLLPGGVISLIEVAHTPFARFFFQHFHHEPYRDQVAQWPFAQHDSMMDSNQALAWIVFVRDRARFEERYPALQIETLELLPWLTYFCSGGVTGRYLIPRFLNPILIGLEALSKPLAPLFSLFWHIRVRKKDRAHS